MNQKLASLDAMGIDVWVRRDATFEADTEELAEVEATIITSAVVSEPNIEAVMEADHTETVVEQLEEIAPQTILETPVEDLIERSPVFESEDESSTSATLEQPAEEKVERDLAATDSWEMLEKRVRACIKCDLHNSRLQTVFGAGDPNADWLIIGEAPGAEEDRVGEPFVGRAGQLLTAMLKAVDQSREKVFIANILKCRPPENRDPRVEEVVSCEPYLQRQIELIKPKVILCVGRIAAQNLLKLDTPIGKMRGLQYVYEPLGIPVVVTYHPAYLLRSPTQKNKTWDDLLLAKSLLEAS